MRSRAVLVFREYAQTHRQSLGLVQNIVTPSALCRSDSVLSWFTAFNFLRSEFPQYL